MMPWSLPQVNGYGIIEVKDWSEMLDAVAILRQSQHWDMEKDDKPLMEWFRRLLAWMLASHKVCVVRNVDFTWGT